MAELERRMKTAMMMAQMMKLMSLLYVIHPKSNKASYLFEESPTVVQPAKNNVLTTYEFFFFRLLNS